MNSSRIVQKHRLLTALAFLLVNAMGVMAHAKLESSAPKAGEVLTAAPDRVTLNFSVAIQPSMSVIVVTDESGSRVDGEIVTASDGDKVISVGLRELGPGKYRVDWRALSADDHMIRGEIRFEVRAPEGKQVTAVEQLPAADIDQKTMDHSEMDHSQMDHSMHEPPADINWVQSLIRWIMYMAMLTLAGGFAFRVFVAGRAAGTTFGGTGGALMTDGLAEYDRRFLTIVFAASVLLILTGIASLIFQSSSIFDTGLIESMSLGQLQAVVSETSFGPVWLLQMSLAAAAFLLVVITRAGRRGALMWLGLVVSAMILLTPGLTGHARAAYADYSFAIISDWVHLIAAAVWVGGLVQIAASVPAMLKAFDGRDRLLLLSNVIANFNKMAMGATALIVITGLYNSWIHVESFNALFDSAYGITLLIKIGISVVMVVLGGVNAFVIHPKIRRMASELDAEVVQSDSATLFQRVKIEIALAIVVLLLAAILAFLPPAREHSMPSATHLDRDRIVALC